MSKFTEGEREQIMRESRRLLAELRNGGGFSVAKIGGQKTPNFQAEILPPIVIEDPVAKFKREADEATERRAAFKRQMRREERMITRAASPAPAVVDAEPEWIAPVGEVIGIERRRGELALGAAKLELQSERAKVESEVKVLAARVSDLANTVAALLKRDGAATAQTRKELKAHDLEIAELRDAFAKLAADITPLVNSFRGLT